jgi:hypothetical protein
MKSTRQSVWLGALRVRCSRAAPPADKKTMIITFAGIDVPILVWPFWIWFFVELLIGVSLGKSRIHRRSREPFGYWLSVSIHGFGVTAATVAFNRS